MSFESFLSKDDAPRASRTLAKLCRHRISSLVLTGGIVVELHLLRLGAPVSPRPLNDIDLLAESFDEIPKGLAADFLMRHVHPGVSAGKTLVQCADPETAVRVDIFRALGGCMDRASVANLSGSAIRLISVEDLTAYTARLCMDLASGAPVPAKHARDFLRLLPMVNEARMSIAWHDHRKTAHPESFADAAEVLERLISTRRDLQVVPVYSQDVTAICPRCEETERFPLADVRQVQSVLGYC